MGILPVIIPLTSIKSYEEEDKRFIKFITIVAIFTAIEVGAIVFIQEEGGKLLPYKVCYRYLALFTIPYFIMFLKLKDKEIKMNKLAYIICVLIQIYMLIYHKFAKRNITLIDAYLLVDFEVLDIYLKYFSTIFISILGIVMAVMIYLFENSKIKKFTINYTKMLIIIAVLLLPVNLTIPVFASNEMIKGKEREKDYIKLAKYINLDYDKVYAYNLKDYYFFGHLISDYKKIMGDKHLEIDTSTEKVLVIVNKDSGWKIEGASKVDIGTKYIDIYVSNEKYSILTIN